MKLNNMSDEELDNLFRASAENFDPPFDPEAWTAMDQKLEQVQPQNKWFNRIYPFLILLTAITFSTISILKNKPQQSTRTTEKYTVKEIKLKGLEKEGSQGVAKHSNLHAPHVDRSEFIQAAPEVNNTEPSYIKPRQRYKSKSPVTEAGTIKPSDFQVSTVNAKSTKAARASDDTSASYYNTGNLSAAKEKGDSVRPFIAAKQGDTLAADISDSVRTGLKEAVVTKPEVSFAPDSTQNIIVEQNQKLKKAAFLSSLQVSLAIAPDFTSVKFKNRDALSANAGILVGVPLTKKISLVTGVVWANKVYRSAAEDYTFAMGYNYTSDVNATCKVLDIPLNIRYTFHTGEKSTLAVQAGISSYLMLSEKYSYKVTYGAYGSHTYDYEEKNENQHWFKVQNISVVYSHMISPAFSIGVEPFVKVPYAGIGAGKVKLTSAGVFFSAGYTLTLKK